jgi:DNA-binding transcriptional LysR family regulator
MLLKWLETFIRLSENRNFSKTAKELYLTQPTISNQIAQLEKELDVVLINRNYKKFSLTKAGEILYFHSIKILKDVEVLKASIDNLKGLKEGEILIGASTLPGEYILPKIIYSFKEKYPEIIINLSIKDSFKCIEELKNGKIEFAVVGFKNYDNTLNFYELFDDEIIFIHNKKGESFYISDLKKLSIITREYGSGTISVVREFFKSKNFSYDSLNFIAKLGSLNAVKEMVKAGLGYAFISKISVKEELKDKKLYEAKIQEVTPIFRRFYIVTSKNLSLSPASKNFIEVLKKTFSN